jgi:hypothetical protein
VSLLKQPGWITLKGKGLAALALRNIGLHQRAIGASKKISSFSQLQTHVASHLPHLT